MADIEMRPDSIEGSPDRMARTAIEPSLPRAAYLEESFYERERRGIWHREWVVVGRDAALAAPGDYLHVDIAGERVILVRTRTGALRGHIDLCRHRGSRLVLDEPKPASCAAEPGPDGTFRGVIRCPYHSWTYELDGPVRHAPFLGEDEGFPAERFGLHPVATATWGGFLFASLDPGALGDPQGSLARRLGRRAARARHHRASRRAPVTGASTDRREWDAAVVGLGALGSAAACWLAARLGDRVVGFERFELGHANGASADHSRIIRLSYHRPDYVRLAHRAYDTWAEIEAEAGERVVTVTGGLDLFPAGAAIADADYAASMDTEGVAYERLAAAEVMRRWPQWRLAEDTTALFQARSGIADPYRGNAAHRRLAIERGATLLEGSPVVSLRESGGGIELTLGDGTIHHAGRVVLAADAWTNDLLASFGRRLPLTVTQEQVTYFASPAPAAFAPERFPIWIWMDDPSFYGFPTYGEAGPKAAQDVGGREVTPATRTFEVDAAALARVEGFLARHLPGAVGPRILTRTCLYTMTPDRDFIVDRLSDAPGVVVLQGAAHGFKFASVLGRIAAELALDGATPSAGDIAAFGIDRSILREDAPVTSFLI